MAPKRLPKKKHVLYPVRQARARTRGGSRLASASRQVLRETPERVVAFLRGVVTYPLVHAELARAGYDRAAHDEGMKLLADVLRLPPAPLVLLDRSVDDAHAELAAFAEQGFRRARAALARLHPEQEHALLSGLETMGAPVLSVYEFLQRFEKLARGSAAARAAVATLEARGFTKDVRGKLSLALETAKSYGELPPDNEDEARHEALLRLRAWYVDWSETAHAVFRGREALVRLGLARRQRGKKVEARATDTEGRAET